MRLFEFDPASLILTNGLTSLAMTAVLLLSLVGLGSEGRGIRTWVLADLALTAARIVGDAAIVGVPWAQHLSFPVLPGALAMLGMVGHVLALRSVAGQPVRVPAGLAWAFGLAALFYLVGSFTPSLTHRLRLFDAALLCGAAVALWALRPLMRFWGARLIAAMMLLAVLFQAQRFGALLLGVGTTLAPDADSHLRDSIRPSSLVIDLIVSLLVTAGFQLLMQERLRARIGRLVVTDSLTGVLNRHGLMPVLQAALSQAQRQARPLSVAMFDLDHFKRINDLHGHATGDQVLAGFSALMASELRGGDALGRWGGEEFLLVLPDTGLVGAQAMAERLRQRVAGEAFVGEVLRLTVSAGVACFEPAAQRSVPDHAQALLGLLETADKRLYLAKQRRNCVVAEDAPLLPPARDA